MSNPPMSPRHHRPSHQCSSAFLHTATTRDTTSVRTQHSVACLRSTFHKQCIRTRFIHFLFEIPIAAESLPDAMRAFCDSNNEHLPNCYLHRKSSNRKSATTILFNFDAVSRSVGVSSLAGLWRVLIIIS